MSLSESFLSGGISRFSSPWRTALMSRLFSGLPATTDGPVSPPARRPPTLSTTSPPLFLPAAWLWHL